MLCVQNAYMLQTHVHVITTYALLAKQIKQQVYEWWKAKNLNLLLVLKHIVIFYSIRIFLFDLANSAPDASVGVT